MTIEGDGFACATNRGEVGAFVRVVTQPERRLVAVADGHTSGGDGGVEEMSRAVLQALDRALADDPSAPLEALFAAARAAFLRAAEPHPEDDVAGGPAAELTVIELLQGRLRAGKLGRAEVLVVRDGVARGESEEEYPAVIAREAAGPAMVEMDVRGGDFVVVAYRWMRDFTGRMRMLSDVVEDLVRAHAEPRDIVAAAVARWRDDVRREQEAGVLYGEPMFAIAVLRV